MLIQFLLQGSADVLRVDPSKSPPTKTISKYMYSMNVHTTGPSESSLSSACTQDYIFDKFNRLMTSLMYARSQDTSMKSFYNRQRYTMKSFQPVFTVH